jgi:RecA-family ATPase
MNVMTIDYLDNKLTRIMDKLEGYKWVDRKIPIAHELHAPNWLVDGFLTDKMTIIAGAPGVGKTSALVPLALLVAGFQSHLSIVECKHKRQVLYVTEDSNQVQTMIYGAKKHLIKAQDSNKLTFEEIESSFHLIQTKRSSAEELALLADLCHQYKTIDNTNGHSTELMPLVVLDTASATFDLDDENSNSQVARYLSVIKEKFLAYGIPVWIVTHTAKAAKRADVKEFSARGAGAFEGDANCVAYLFQEDGLDQRFLMLGKHRYVAKFTELKFDSCTHEEQIENSYGEPESVLYRYTTIDRSDQDSRISAKMDAKEEKELDREKKYKQRIFDAIDKLEFPTRNAVAMYQGKKGMNLKLIDDLIQSGEIVTDITQEKSGNNRTITVLKRNLDI